MSKTSHSDDVYVGPEEPMCSGHIPVGANGGSGKRQQYLTLCRLKEQSESANSVGAHSAYVAALNKYTAQYGANPFED